MLKRTFVSVVILVWSLVSAAPLVWSGDEAKQNQPAPFQGASLSALPDYFISIKTPFGYYGTQPAALRHLAESLAREGVDPESISIDEKNRRVALWVNQAEYFKIKTRFGARVTVLKTEKGPLGERGFRMSKYPVRAEAGRNVGAGRDLPLLTKNGFPVIDDGYHTSRQVEQILIQFNQAAPAITKLIPIGTSVQGRTIWALKISDNPDLEEDELPILFDGQHHAREIMTPEVVLDTILQLLSGYGTDATVTEWVNQYEIWCVPVVNPDGNEIVFSQNASWRKNARDNNGNELFDGSDGVDLNRNYPFYWGGWANGSSSTISSSTYRGPQAASEPETQAMMALAEKEHFVFAISYHSSGQAALYALSSNPTKSPQNINIVASHRRMARLIAEEYASRVFKEDGQPGYAVAPNFYSVDGVDCDWHYFAQNTITFNTEINTSQQPSYSIRNVTVAGLRPGWKYLLDRMNGPAISGHIYDAKTGAPVLAEILVDELVFHNGEVLTNEPVYGRFHIIVVPGTYHVRIVARGYTEQELVLSVGERPSDITMNLEPERFRMIIFEDDFETDKGWRVNLKNEDTASAGRWQYATPLPNGSFRNTSSSSNFHTLNPAFDHTPFSGRKAFVTGNAVVTAPSTGDLVRNGFTSLYSPPFDASGYHRFTLDFYWRFINLFGGSLSNLKLEISNDDGETFLPLWDTPQTNVSPLGTGFYARKICFVTSQDIPFTDKMRLRFRAAQDPLLSTSFIEAALDDVRIVGDNPPPAVSISVVPEVVRAGEPFMIEITSNSLAELKSVWWWAEDINNSSWHVIEGTVDEAFVNLARAQDFGTCSGMHDCRFSRTVTIEEPGMYRIGANARDNLYPNGEPHQASEGQGIPYVEIEIRD